MQIAILILIYRLVSAVSKDCTQADLPWLFGSFQHNGWASGILNHSKGVYLINNSIELESRCLCKRSIEPLQQSLSEESLDMTTKFVRSPLLNVINQIRFEYRNNDIVDANVSDTDRRDDSLSMARIITAIRLTLYPLLTEHLLVFQHCRTRITSCDIWYHCDRYNANNSSVNIVNQTPKYLKIVWIKRKLQKVQEVACHFFPQLPLQGVPITQYFLEDDERYRLWSEKVRKSEADQYLVPLSYWAVPFGWQHEEVPLDTGKWYAIALGQSILTLNSPKRVSQTYPVLNAVPNVLRGTQNCTDKLLKMCNQSLEIDPTLSEMALGIDHNESAMVNELIGICLPRRPFSNFTKPRRIMKIFVDSAGPLSQNPHFQMWDEVFTSELLRRKLRYKEQYTLAQKPKLVSEQGTFSIARIMHLDVRIIWVMKQILEQARDHVIIKYPSWVSVYPGHIVIERFTSQVDQKNANVTLMKISATPTNDGTGNLITELSMNNTKINFTMIAITPNDEAENSTSIDLDSGLGDQNKTRNITLIITISVAFTLVLCMIARFYRKRRIRLRDSMNY